MICSLRWPNRSFVIHCGLGSMLHVKNELRDAGQDRNGSNCLVTAN